METFVVRVWLPDRPGALGAVASRVGAVRGDVVGIEILERGGGRAVDDLVVELPRAELVSLLVAEIAQVDGVDVEDVRPAQGKGLDPRVEAFRVAGRLIAAEGTEELLECVVGHACGDVLADWCVAVDVGSGALVASTGDPPQAAWLAAFVSGTRSSDPDVEGDGMAPDDVAWAELPSAGLSVVLGRHNRPLRVRERRQLSGMVAIADRRWSELSARAVAAGR